MSTSKEVFALRREGMLDDAYAMAIDVVHLDPHDEWNIKALAWCLYDLIKRSVAQKDSIATSKYATHLSQIHIDEYDDVLFKSVNHALVLANPEKQIIRDAKEKSQNGNHIEALRLYREAHIKFPDDISVNEQFAWELQKEGKLIFEAEKVNVLDARKLLAEYIKLKNERPSRLHSLFLKYANKIIDSQEFNLVSFAKLWDLNNLTSEDFEPFVKDGNTYPCIAEKIIQHTSKLILEKKMAQEVEYILPFVDKGINTFKDNIWLPYYKAKLLHLVNRNEEAIEFLIPVVKEKITEYWVWSLLGDLVVGEDKEKALSCYCKSLLCKAEVKFLASVRLKIAQLLIQKELWKEAKCEIITIINSKEQGAFIPDILVTYQQNDWYKSSDEKRNNIDFYNSNKQQAEEFIFHALPWYNGSLGDTFTVPERPDKPRRKLFIKLQNETIETIVSDRKFNTSKNYKVGESIKIKGEYDKEKSFQVYLLEKRNAIENWDIFDWCQGNIVREINKEDQTRNAWVVSVKMLDQLKEGIIKVKSIIPRINLEEGLPVFVRYYQKGNKSSSSRPIRNVGDQEEKIHILSISERKEGQFWDTYPNHVGIVDHVNTEKGIVHFIVNTKINGTIAVNKIADKLEIGTKLLLKLKEVKKANNSYFTVLTCSVTEQETTYKIIKTFSGSINISGSFGFVDDVFIESSLFQINGIEDNDLVKGNSIINFNKRKGTWGWKAFEIH